MYTTEDNMRLYIAILLVINLFNPVCNLTRNFYRTFFSKDFICFILCTWVFVYVFCVCLVFWGGRRESGVTLSYCVGAGSLGKQEVLSTADPPSCLPPPVTLVLKLSCFIFYFSWYFYHIKFSFVILLCILFGQNNVSHDIFIWIYKVILKLALFIKKAKYVIFYINSVYDEYW